ncbi:MAG: nitrite/sulfite reductase [Actinomycetota bacterium]
MGRDAPQPLWRQKIDVERVKSEGLQVDLERLEREGYESLTPEEFYRLKTWGVCSQRTPGLHMIRVKVPGGRIGAGQLRGVAAISEALADGETHITVRQQLELHDVASRNVRSCLEKISWLGLTTRSACGHAVRGIVGCARAGICSEEVLDISPVVQGIHEFFIGRADHYNSRLPRRLNVYVAGCARCMAHAQINDLGFVATRRGGEVGFQLWCAGSLASNPRLAYLLFGFIPTEEVLSVTQAVADVYCAHGLRKRPAKARLKFLVEEWGEQRFAEAVMERLKEIRPGSRTSRNGQLPVLGPDRRPAGGHGGVFPQRQTGYVAVEAHVRLGDLDQNQMAALAALAEAHADGNVYLTREQNAELHWIREEHAAVVTAALEAAGLLPKGAGSLVDVQACAGTEWCVWGIGDSRGLARQIHGALAEVVASDPEIEPLRVHVSGCFHGCAQHQAGDIGLSAVRSSDGACSDEGFEIWGGGRLGVEPIAGRRIGRIPLDETPEVVIGLLTAYLKERAPGEDFSTFLEREGRRLLQDLRVAEGAMQEVPT